MLVSVSGVGGLSATKGLETVFSGLGLKFQEVAAPTGTEILTAVKSLQDEYREVIAARDELVSDIKDLTTPEERFQDALVINLNNWNGVEPSIGDYILGSESGCIAQVIDVSIKLGKTLSIVVDHVKLGPTIITSQGDEDRILELETRPSANNLYLLRSPFTAKGFNFSSTLNICISQSFSNKDLSTKSKGSNSSLIIEFLAANLDARVTTACNKSSVLFCLISINNDARK